MVRLLLDGDAKAQEIVNKDGKTPIDIARDMENGECLTNDSLIVKTDLQKNAVKTFLAERSGKV